MHKNIESEARMTSKDHRHQWRAPAGALLAPQENASQNELAHDAKLSADRK